MTTTAKITITLDPKDHRRIRSALEAQATDTRERAREIRGENPRQANQLLADADYLDAIVESI